MLINYWYVACRSKNLTNKPLGKKILNEEIVLFRDSNNNAVILKDVCPHRNVQLSKGKNNKGNLQCAYHGWEFDGKGKCVFIPSLMSQDKISSELKIKKYNIIEQQGFIWVWIGDREPENTEKPVFIEELELDGWSNTFFYGETNTSIDNVIENFMDSPHTGYLHGGLFRSNKEKHTAKAIIKTTDDGVTNDITEEDSNIDSLLGNLLIGKNSKVFHQDKFILPSIVKVQYEMGTYKMRGYHIFTPIDEYKTEINVRVVWNFGLIGNFIKPLVTYFGVKILKQDVEILDNQGEIIKKYGEDFSSSSADTINVYVKNILNKVKENKEFKTNIEKEIEFRL